MKCFSLFTSWQSCSLFFYFCFQIFGFFDTCTVFLINFPVQWSDHSNISYQLPCCVHQQRSPIFIVIAPIPAPYPGPISFLPFTRCFKGSDFQRIKLMQNKCVALMNRVFLLETITVGRDGENPRMYKAFFGS